MSRVIFFQLTQPNKDLALCRIASSSFMKGNRVVIAAAGRAHAERLDGLLWTWAQDSFVPHRVARPDDSGASEPVVICVEEINPFDANVLLLGDERTFEYMLDFDTVIDFAEVYDEQKKLRSRARFKLWRERGIEPEFTRST